MSINLSDGQGINLKDESGHPLKQLRIKLGWNVPHKPSRMWFSDFFEQNVIECNAYMVMFREKSMVHDEDIISYCNPEHDSKSVRYLGKCLDETGSVSEVMLVDFDKVPLKYDSIVFMADVSRLKGDEHFGMIRDAYIQITDDNTNQKICRYNLLENYDDMVSIVFGILFRCVGGWEFVAVGEGTKDETVGYMVRQMSYFDSAIAL